MRGRAVLPNSKPKPAIPFPIRAKVVLKCCPSEIPGVVRGVKNKRVVVEWSDLGYTGRYKPQSLMLVTDTEEK
jgi:hypothetical protein